MATVWAGRCLIAVKYARHPNPVLTSPSTSRGGMSSAGTESGSLPESMTNTATVRNAKRIWREEFSNPLTSVAFLLNTIIMAYAAAVITAQK